MPSVLTPDLPRPAQALPPEFLPPDLSPIANAEISRIRGLRQVYQEMPTCRRADYVIASTHFAERAELSFLGDYFFEQPFSQYTGPLCETQGGHLFQEIDVRVSPAIPGVEARLALAPGEMLKELRAVREAPERAAGSVGAAGGYSHLLIPRRVKYMTNSVGQDLPRTATELAYNPAYLHPSDLAALGFSSGDLVQIESEDGAISAIVEAAGALRPGVVSMAHCFGGDPAEDADPRQVESSTAALISVDHDYDPISGQARQSAILTKGSWRTPRAGSLSWDAATFCRAGFDETNGPPRRYTLPQGVGSNAVPDAPWCYRSRRQYA